MIHEEALNPKPKDPKSQEKELQGSSPACIRDADGPTQMLGLGLRA